MMPCKICGGNVTLKVGFDGLAASLIAYFKASFSLHKYNDGSLAFYMRCFITVASGTPAHHSLFK